MKSFLLIIVFCICYSICFSQIKTDVLIKHNEKGIIESVEFLNNGGPTKVPDSAAIFFKEFLKIKGKDNFVLIRKVNEKIGGFRNEHYDQYYSNIKIDGAGYNFHFKNEKLYYAHGYFVNIDSLNTMPTMTSEKAIETYATYLNIPLSSIANSVTELLITEMFSKKDNPLKPCLIYKVKIVSNVKNITEYGLVDAHSGEVLSTRSFIADYSETGTFDTRYNGNKQGITEYYNGSYHLADYSRNTTIHTYNLQGGTLYSNAIDLSDANNNWTNAEHSTNENDMALDVHWGLQQVYDYFYNNHGYNSYNDSGAPITSYIRFGNSFSDRNGASFDMSDDVMRFGDGTVLKPLASLDVVAHEYGHGITDFQIGWEYSDTLWPLKAFHEGLSDIWAIIMDYRLTSQQPWKIGEQIDLTYDCLRSIIDPHGNNNNARHKIADTYFSDTYNNGDSHTKGGLFSYMFYLLVNGGAGTNDLGRNYIVQGVGMDLAEELIVHTVFEGHLNEIHSWQGIKDAMVVAAHDIVNCNSNYSSTLANQVENAWYAVGVGTLPSKMYITGPTLLCFSSDYYTLNDLMPNSTVSWSCSNNITRISPKTNNPCYFQANSSGSGWIRATIHSQCDSIAINYNMWAGVPSVEVTGPSEGATGNSYSFYEYPATYSEPTSFDWTLSPSYDGNSIYNYGYWANAAFYSQQEGYFQIGCTPQNSCGTGSMATKYISIYNYGYRFSISPNPASDVITITIKRLLTNPDDVKQNNIEDEKTTFTIHILDTYGKIHLSTTRFGNSFTLPIKNLNNGNYFIQINDGKRSSNLKLIVKH